MGGARTLEGDDLVVHVEIELRYRAPVPSRLCLYDALRARSKKLGVEMKPVTWEEKVEARGREQGREQGRELGKEEGMRELLLR